MAQKHEMDPSSNMGQEHEFHPNSEMGQENKMHPSSKMGQEYEMDPSSDMELKTIREYETDASSDIEENETYLSFDADVEYESDSSIEKLDMEDESEIDPGFILNKLLTSTDEIVHHPMIVMDRQFYRLDGVYKFHAAAVEKDPTNILLLTDLFMDNVETSNYRKQFDTALALYNVVPCRVYFFWAVMSIVMQASRIIEKENQLLLLAVAERMIVNLTKIGDRIKTYHEVQLYLMILEMQGKLKKALDIVEGRLGKKLHCIGIQEKKRADLLIKLGRWKEANVTLKKMLRANMDNWSLYAQYFDTAFHLIDETSIKPTCDMFDGEKPDRTIMDCVKFVCQLYENNFCQSIRVRGPFLAKLQLFVRLKARGINGAPYLGNVVDMMFMYFFDFGEKLCCLNDLKPYLDLLQPSEASQFLSRTLTIIELQEEQIPMTRLQMNEYISRVLMTHYLGFHDKLSEKSKLQLAADFMHYYRITVQLNAGIVLPNNVQHSDTYALLVATLLSSVWVETGLAVYLRDAIVVLEYVLSKSPSNFHIKLLLIRLYNTLGVSQAAHKIYKLLKIEQLQLDSLGYLQCGPLHFTGQYQLASKIYDTTIKFFRCSHKTSLYLISSALSYGSFVKISELIGLHNRLKRSLHNSLVAVEKKLLNIFHEPTFHETLTYFIIDDIKMIATEKVQWSQFVDNRDFELYWTAEPCHRQITRDMVKTSFYHEVCYLQYRTLLLRIVVKLADICINYDDNEPRSVLEPLINKLKFLSQNFGENLQPLYKVSVISPDESRIFTVIESSYSEFVLHLLNIVISLAAKSTTSGPNLKNTCNSIIMNAATSLEQEIFKLSALIGITSPAQLVQRQKILMSLTLIIEGESAENQEHTIDPAEQLVKVINKSMHDLDSMIGTLENEWKNIEPERESIYRLLEKLELSSSEVSQIVNNVHNKFSESYLTSLREIHAVLRTKIKYLSELM